MDGLEERGGDRHDAAWNADQERHLEAFERADEGEQQDRQDGGPRQG